MTLKESVKSDFMSAYKAKDMVKKNFLSVLKGSIETNEGKGIESNDVNVLKLIKSLEKGLNETIIALKENGLDTSETENELNYLKPYLPTLMSEDEVRNLIKVMISKTDNKNQGFLMGQFIKENQGKGFDNKIVSNIIKEEL